MKEFELHFHCENGGDGSANVRFHKTQQEAEQADEEQPEGWGESSAGSLRLKIQDGKLFYRSFEDVDGKYRYVWHEVEEVV